MRRDLETGDCGAIVFEEYNAMGVSMKSLWTKSVSTWKCLYVKLGDRQLRIGLHGLFGTLVKPFGADLDHDIPVSDVISVTRGKDSFGRGEVAVTFRLPRGGERTILLYLKKADEFTALASISAGL